jgi:hypothetical protein
MELIDVKEKEINLSDRHILVLFLIFHMKFSLSLTRSLCVNNKAIFFLKVWKTKLKNAY